MLDFTKKDMILNNRIRCQIGGNKLFESHSRYII